MPPAPPRLAASPNELHSSPFTVKLLHGYAVLGTNLTLNLMIAFWFWLLARS